RPLRAAAAGQVGRVFRPAVYFIAIRAARAALMGFATSASLCAPERNHASNCDGGGEIPRPSISLKNFPYIAASALIADWKSRTGSLVKNRVTSEAKTLTRTGTAARRGST